MTSEERLAAMPGNLKKVLANAAIKVIATFVTSSAPWEDVKADIADALDVLNYLCPQAQAIEVPVSESRIPIYRREVAPGIAFHTFSSEGTEKVGEIWSNRLDEGESYFQFTPTDFSTIFGFHADAALAYARAGQKGLRFEGAGCKLADLIEFRDKYFRSARPEPIADDVKSYVRKWVHDKPAVEEAKAAQEEMGVEPPKLSYRAAVKYAAPYETALARIPEADRKRMMCGTWPTDPPAEHVVFTKSETVYRNVQPATSENQRRIQDEYQAMTEPFAKMAVDVQEDVEAYIRKEFVETVKAYIDAAPKSFKERTLEAMIASGPAVAQMASATTDPRRSCMFEGGPFGGQIFEIPDSTMSVDLPTGEGCPVAPYDRRGTTFVFSGGKAEPAREKTWRDRAIEEPML